MDELAIAIKNHFDAAPGSVHNAFYIDVNGQLYNTRAPMAIGSTPAATYPYSVFSFITNVYEFTFTEDIENLIVQFSLLSATGMSTVQIGKMYTDLKALFDWAALTVTGYTHIYMRRETDHGLTTDDNDVWVRSVDYRVLLYR